MSRRKVRPAKGSGLNPDMSLRDIEAATGVSVAQLERARRVADIPEAEFEALIESDAPPTVSELVRLGRAQRGTVSPPRRVRRCPHCGAKLTGVAT